MLRVLQRRIDRWARAAEAEGREDVARAAGAARQQAAEVARRLVQAGAVDDASFAASRARRLAKGGKSRRAIAAHLAAKGVKPGVVAAVPQDVAEIDAALAFCRRRRIGPFGPAELAPEQMLKALAALARAGFGRDTAEQALRMDSDAAADRLNALRNG